MNRFKVTGKLIYLIHLDTKYQNHYSTKENNRYTCILFHVEMDPSRNAQCGSSGMTARVGRWWLSSWDYWALPKSIFLWGAAWEWRRAADWDAPKIKYLKLATGTTPSPKLNKNKGICFSKLRIFVCDSVIILTLSWKSSGKSRILKFSGEAIFAEKQSRFCHLSPNFCHLHVWLLHA